MYKILFLVFACTTICDVVTAQQVTTLSAHEFQKRMKAERGYLLDVRTDWEYETGFIDGAIHADIHEEKFRALADRLDNHKPCFVYCFSGGRSQEAGNYLISKGFTHVYELQGGIAAWQKAGLPVQKYSK